MSMSPSDNHKPPIKAFLIDLDGTLIGPDERISPRVAHAVKRVSGYQVSGRGFSNQMSAVSYAMSVRRSTGRFALAMYHVPLHLMAS